MSEENVNNGINIGDVGNKQIIMHIETISPVFIIKTVIEKANDSGDSIIEGKAECKSMKSAKELADYTYINSGAMQEWYNREYGHAEKVFNIWVRESGIERNTGVFNCGVYNLEGDVIIYNYMKALSECREEFTTETVAGAVDIVLQEMAKKLSNKYARLLQANRCLIVMRANSVRECMMYVGTYLVGSKNVDDLFGDEGVFMKRGLAALSFE